tara:strand:- start:5 stop:232 length:228 start_codon:yes stop_codon:yes gene_type:complete
MASRLRFPRIIYAYYLAGFPLGIYQFQDTYKEIGKTKNPNSLLKLPICTAVGVISTMMHPVMYPIIICDKLYCDR